MIDDLWASLGAWWLHELCTDPVYNEEIAPMLMQLLEPQRGGRYLDVGCGEGRILRMLEATGCQGVGCDLNLQLLRRARCFNSVVRTRLPELGWIRTGSFDGAVIGLVLEHLPDESALFTAVARAVRSNGTLALVINHPIWTAPGSSPIEESSGETLWRPGEYFRRGHSDEPAGESTVRFYHRTLSDLLNAASAAGWDLLRLEERGLSPEKIAQVLDLAGQEHIPRLLGARWSRR